MVKPEILRGLLIYLKENLGKLKTLASLPQEDFLQDFTKLESAKYLLQTSIQTCIDIANHLIASEGWRNPEDYADAFRVLYENKVIPADFLDTAARMVKLRNRLVHLYMAVDDEVVYRILRENLRDFELFADYILKAFKEELEK